jgi:hypothetical protein
MPEGAPSMTIAYYKTLDGNIGNQGTVTITVRRHPDFCP